MHVWHEETSCSTTACIAGWAVLMEAEENPRVCVGRGRAWIDGKQTAIEHAAQDLLGLSHATANNLFHPPLSENCQNVTPQQAAAALRTLAGTGRLNWSDFIPPE